MWTVLPLPQWCEQQCESVVVDLVHQCYQPALVFTVEHGARREKQ
ncbi:MAG: hypothetical protein ABI228_03780 [Burkholderiaceae bacterium]